MIHKILQIMGTGSLDQIKQNYAIWSKTKNDLYEHAKALLGKAEVRAEDQEALVDLIKNFKVQTIEMNKSYTNAVISKLQEILGKASTKTP